MEIFILFFTYISNFFEIYGYGTNEQSDNVFVKLFTLLSAFIAKLFPFLTLFATSKFGVRR